MIKIVGRNLIKEKVKDLIEKESSFIIVIKDSKDCNIRSCIVNNNRLRFMSVSNPAGAIFIDSPKEEVLSKIIGDSVIFNKFDNGYSYDKLIKFSEEYDKENNSSSKDFYEKYKDLFMDNI